ncbi:SRPBCC family protein [Desertihabitans aurantiacus]|uniref:SRPBCC domain-containing protein n=1 Tax=Desertihabitans aurantiacus TaxID=2282477 RepID=UPI000DF74F60|nr:SRPBCC domain-containing protein [Desertihabitans aurantiacus]
MPPLMPIRLDLELPVAPAAAFDAYVDLGSWWDPRYTSDATTFSGVAVTPGPGGEIRELHADGSSQLWGTITLWQPGTALSHSFVLAHDTGVPSQVLVTFTARPGGSLLRLQHGGWNEDNATDRDRFTDWATVLAGLPARVHRGRSRR